MADPTHSDFQTVVEQAEALPPEQQAALVELLHRRQIENRREELARRIEQARGAFTRGEVTRGDIGQLLDELNS